MLIALHASGQHSNFSHVQIDVNYLMTVHMKYSVPHIFVLVPFEGLIKSCHELNHLHFQWKIYLFGNLQSNIYDGRIRRTLFTKSIKNIFVNLLTSKPLQIQVLDHGSMLQFFNFLNVGHIFLQILLRISGKKMYR